MQELYIHFLLPLCQRELPFPKGSIDESPDRLSCFDSSVPSLHAAVCPSPLDLRLLIASSEANNQLIAGACVFKPAQWRVKAERGGGRQMNYDWRWMETLFANVPQGSTTSFVAQIRSKSLCRWVSVGQSIRLKIAIAGNGGIRYLDGSADGAHMRRMQRTGCWLAGSYPPFHTPQGNGPLPSRSFCCHCCCHYQFKPTAAPMDRDSPCKRGYAKCRRQLPFCHFLASSSVSHLIWFHASNAQIAAAEASVGVPRGVSGGWWGTGKLSCHRRLCPIRAYSWCTHSISFAGYGILQNCQ